MNTLNLKLYDYLLEWDPFEIGSDNYDPEFADIIGAVNYLEEIEELATKIQSIFEFSFERTIPMDVCLEKAKQLLQIKDEDGSCMIN